MLIRVGYELIFNCPQATPMILMVNIHYSRASDIVTPDLLTTDPATRVTAYRDGFGNWCSRIVAPIGRIRLKASGVVRDWAQPDAVVASCPAACFTRLAGRDAGLSVGQPLLRDRSAVGASLVALRPVAAGLAARPGHLRFCPQPYRFQLSKRALYADRVGGVQRANRRLPGLRALGHRTLPLDEHSSALLHRIPGRHWDAAALWRDGFCRVV